MSQYKARNDPYMSADKRNYCWDIIIVTNSRYINSHKFQKCGMVTKQLLKLGIFLLFFERFVNQCKGSTGKHRYSAGVLSFPLRS